MLTTALGSKTCVETLLSNVLSVGKSTERQRGKQCHGLRIDSACFPGENKGWWQQSSCQLQASCKCQTQLKFSKLR